MNYLDHLSFDESLDVPRRPRRRAGLRIRRTSAEPTTLSPWVANVFPAGDLKNSYRVLSPVVFPRETSSKSPHAGRRDYLNDGPATLCRDRRELRGACLRAPERCISRPERRIGVGGDHPGGRGSPDQRSSRLRSNDPSPRIAIARRLRTSRRTTRSPSIWWPLLERSRPWSVKKSSTTAAPETILAWAGWRRSKHVPAPIQPGLELIALDPKRIATILGHRRFERRSPGCRRRRGTPSRIGTGIPPPPCEQAGVRSCSPASPSVPVQ